MMVFFQLRLGKILIWQILSQTLACAFNPGTAQNNELYRVGHGYFRVGYSNYSLFRGSRIWYRGPTRVAFLSQVGGYSK